MIIDLSSLLSDSILGTRVWNSLAKVLQESLSSFLQTYWPESNVLIPPEWDPLSEEPDYNCMVRIERLKVSERSIEADVPQNISMIERQE